MKRKVYTPLGPRVLIKHDKDEAKSKGGILLPDEAKLFVLTGLVIAVSEKLKADPLECPCEELDRVLYDTRHRTPVSLDPTNDLFFVHYEHIYGIVREEGEDDPPKEAPEIEEMPNKTQWGGDHDAE